MHENQCKSCQYFIQHFALDHNRTFRVHCGHCTYKRVNRKLPDSKACEHFTPAPAQEEAFVTREYLSKELLQYMLRLELLPEIEDKV